jgi:hypothetical protein
MKPLMIGPDGLVESATHRDRAHLTHCLDVKVSSSKPTSQNVRKQTPRSCGGSLDSGAATVRLMKSCPLCRSQVREDRLESHMVGRCPLRPGAKPSLSSRLKSTTSSSRSSLRSKTTISLRDIQLFVKCPACGVKVASDQFTKHRALAHRRGGQSRGKFQTPVVHDLGRSHDPGVGERSRQRKAAEDRVHPIDNAAPESLRHKGKVEAETPSWRNNLDATKDYGYPAREEGRYGSYPSHDGFDDESKP